MDLKPKWNQLREQQDLCYPEITGIALRAADSAGISNVFLFKKKFWGGNKSIIWELIFM